MEPFRRFPLNLRSDPLSTSPFHKTQTKTDFHSTETERTSDWKWQLQHRIKTKEELSSKLSLTEEEISSFDACSESFEFSVTPYYLGLADPNDPHCPIRLQIVPRGEELIRGPLERQDPLAEESFMPVKGVTHRYPDRAIWYLSHVCAVYCRFCTRKRKVSKSFHTPGKEEWEQALEYFRTRSEIREVILSGGDPLNLSNEKLDFLLGELKSIPHINQVRIHSRYPVTLPMRIDSELCAIFKKHYPLYLVTHFNHAKEITPLVKEKTAQLALEGGVTILNQGVLLKGINDSVETLTELFYGLTSIGIKPYYLHQCDEVWGSVGFRVEIEKGVEIMKRIRGKISGISVPLYVVDLTGGGGKVPLPGDYLVEKKERSYVFRNYREDLYEIGY